MYDPLSPRNPFLWQISIVLLAYSVSSDTDRDRQNHPPILMILLPCCRCCLISRNASSFLDLHHSLSLALFLCLSLTPTLPSLYFYFYSSGSQAGVPVRQSGSIRRCCEGEGEFVRVRAGSVHSWRYIVCRGSTGAVSALPARCYCQTEWRV